MVRKSQESGWQATSRELGFRLSCYLPEYVNLLFDEKSETESIADLFPVLPEEARRVERNVQKRLDEIDAMQQDIGGREKALDENAGKLIKEAGEFFPDFLTSLNNWADEIQGISRVEGVDRQVAEVDPGKLNETLNSWKEKLENLLGSFSSWKTGLGRRLEEKWEEHSLETSGYDLETLDNEIAILEHEIAELERIEKSGEGVDELSKLQEILEQLGNADYQQKTVQLLEDKDLSALAEELKLVRPERAADFAGRLHEMLGEKKEQVEAALEGKREKLENKKKEREDIFSAYPAKKQFDRMIAFLEEKESVLGKIDQFVEDGNKLKKDKAEQEQIEAEKKELHQIRDFFHKQSAELETLRKAVENSLNSVLRRFVMVNGFSAGQVAVRIDKGGLDDDEEGKEVRKNRFRIYADREKSTRDGETNGTQRNVDCFSSGQKAQMAMAWLVACRELVHNKANRDVVRFPHQVLIMDDPSTTFDQSNLHSQAILWRQLAYNSDPEKRYQVFIVSHHEEFSSRLLDLLCPPGDTGEGEKAKCRMKLLRFTDWTPDKGSEIEIFDVQPQPAKLAAAKEAFKHGLELLGRES